MWSSLTSDLNEFVSTVAGDTAEALNRMDENFPDGADSNELSPAEEERLRRLEMPETFESPLISDDDEEDYKKDVEEYLSTFSIDTKTDEIAKLLEEDPDTLKVAFEALVPTKVKYEDFWQRYFYRCDETRINAEIEEEEQEAEAARAETFKRISAVGNLLGGAVKAVSASLTEEEKTFQATKNTFGRSGRPPFVLNTAVSEDDDDEEELGWDDEEEEDDDDNNNNDNNADDSGEGQIEFNDVVTEKLKDELKLAIEERDQLHETVALQQKEIVNLKTHGAESSEIESLKTQLFEKESEVAALRASAMDESQDHAEVPSSAEEKILEAKVESLMEKVAALTKRASEDKATIENERTQNEELQSRLTTLESSAQASTDRVQTLESENANLKSKLAEAEKRAKALEKETSKLEEQLRQKEDMVGEASVDSPDTGVSSSVKVELEEDQVIPEAIPEAKAGGSEDEATWDDDW